jgi:hypothetical protein
MTWCSVDKATPRFDLASSAIRCRFVDRFVRPKVLSRVSRQRFSPRDAPHPSIGSRRVRFPDVISTMRALRLPTHTSPVTYLLRFRGPRDSSSVRARRRRRSRAGGGPASDQDHCSTGDPLAGVLSHGRERDLSGSQAIHPVPLLRSTTPAEPMFPRHGRSHRCCPCQHEGKGFSVTSISGLPRASAPAVYASRVVLPPPMQDSLPAGWLTFAARESNPLDRDERFPSPTSSSPFPGFILTLRAHDPNSPCCQIATLPWTMCHSVCRSV